MRGTPKWMIFKDHPIEMDDLGVSPIYGNPQTIVDILIQAWRSGFPHIELIATKPCHKIGRLVYEFVPYGYPNLAGKGGRIKKNNETHH